MKQRIALTVAMVALAAAGIAGFWIWRSTRTADAGDAPPDAGGAPAASGMVTLTEAKREAAGIQVERVARRRFQQIRQVPGRLRYDDTRHVEIRAAADGTMQACPVKPGDRVDQGQTLAVLSSPEIGLARAEVLRRNAERALAERQLQWRQQTDRNLQELVGEIQRRRPLDEIENQFRGRPLGDFREKLLSAYSRLLLAESMVTSIQAATGQGAVAERTLRERVSERQTAEAALRSACEQSAFDSRMACSAAEAQLDDAGRKRDVARQQLRMLLGHDEPLSRQPEGAADPVVGEALSLVESRAPFAGTIESQRFAVSERIQQGETMLVLADTSRLWAVADVRERDWQALSVSRDQELELEFPALPEMKLKARLHYVGREVMPETNAVPLVATVDNRDERLRPGLYVRMALPLGPPREALAVPAAAVVEHERTKFVFVADSTTSFRRVAIQAGEATEDWVEVTAGLTEGMTVVTEGAFALKSELLLEREE